MRRGGNDACRRAQLSSFTAAVIFIMAALPLPTLGQEEPQQLDSCAEAQQVLEDYLAAEAPAGPRNACHGSVGVGADPDALDAAQVQTTAVCAAWSGRCAANESVSECSVGCDRVPGCRAVPGPPPLAQPDHPHGEEAAGVAGACVPDVSQCVCPEDMVPLVETMYLSCPSAYTSGEHWELIRPRWKATVESWGCNAAGGSAAPLRWALAAVLVLQLVAAR